MNHSEPEPVLPILPYVIVYVEGGVVQGARSSVPIEFAVADVDNLEGNDDEEDVADIESLITEYEKLPFAAF